MAAAVQGWSSGYANVFGCHIILSDPGSSNILAQNINVNNIQAV
jgi:hypothetical protein